MSIELSQINQQLPMRIASPQLVAANHILALSSAELQAAIQREVNENPAMDVEEAPVCSRCGRPLQRGACLECDRRSSADDARANGEQQGDHADDTDGAHDDGMGSYGSRRQGGREDDGFDPATRVASQISLTESLTLSLQAQFPKEDAPLIEYLVGNLDDDGRLHCETDDVVDLFDVEPAQVERIIQALQAMEPIGVGARDLRECLLIQLDYIEAQGHHQPYAREVIGRFLVELSEHKYGQIAFALGTTTENIHAVSEFIRRNLNPFPGRGRLDSSVTAGEAATPIAPDVIITSVTQPDGSSDYEVEIVESKRFYLRVNPSYEQLYTAAGARTAALSEADRRHVQQYVSRARLFIANIKQRRQTLGRITRCIVRLQH
ncbi:MAG TPA: hypothetical protein VKQ36_09575, partial [Ktedonobacterales bacterium]|nr:hypothetical protein [Ktedonobacterales bacterium]